MSKAQARALADPTILLPAVWDAIKKLNPRAMARNPVMFVVEIVATLTTVLFIRDIVKVMETLDLSDRAREMIYNGNATRMLQLGQVPHFHHRG